MKLRIQGQSLRLRLKQGELAEFARTGVVQDEISFGDTRLVYRLVSRPDISDLRATFEEHLIEVAVPESRARRWSETEEVGMAARQSLPHGVELRILVEKDFKCLTARPGEDESDSFPHPAEGHSHC